MELPPLWRDWDLGLELADDISAAEWVVAALRPWGSPGDGPVSLASFVPDVYEAFARILHPARGEDGRDIRWADLAAVRGRIVGPDTSLSEATGIMHVNGRSVVENGTPSDGSLPSRQMARLGTTLAPFTTATDPCVFCFWVGNGFWGGRVSYSTGGGNTPEQDEAAIRIATERARREGSEIARVPWLHLPGREYYVFTGALTRTRRPFVFEHRWEQSPNMWWPSDRAWFVATEVDGYSTYVGGTRACIDAVLAAPDIEAITVAPETAIDPGPYR